MSTKADFYTEKYGKLEWVGSLYEDGEPWNIPLDVLIQINAVTYEEHLLQHLRTKQSAIALQDRWPWDWHDSRMTDYSYIFMNDNVVGYSPYERGVFDPISIVKGHDLAESSYFLKKKIKFPTMKRLRFYG